MRRHLVFFIALVEKLPIVRGMVLDESRCVLSPLLKPQAGNPIFIAVHGTFWLTRADWIHQNSFLLSNLQKCWPSAGIYAFRWSGVNGVRHRLLASEILARELKGLAKSHPSCPLVVIAHSHGGNVAAWAAAQADTSLFAAVYMSTPFIQALEEPAAFYNQLLGTIALSSWCVCAFCAYKLFMWMPTAFPETNDVLVFRVARVTLIVSIPAALFRLLKTWSPIKRKLAEFRNRLHAVTRKDRNAKYELAFSMVGDEAVAALLIQYLMQWLGHRLMLLLVVALSIGQVAAFLFQKRMSRQITDAVFLGSIGSGLLVLFAIFLTGLLVYGLIHSLLALDGTITVTAAPTGKTDSIIVRWSKTDRFRHSHVYRSQEAVQAMTEWLKDKLASSNTSLSSRIPRRPSFRR